eukprot:8005670-Pyramimonas_sp.AAC.1
MSRDRDSETDAACTTRRTGCANRRLGLGAPRSAPELEKLSARAPRDGLGRSVAATFRADGEGGHRQLWAGSL